MSVHHILNQKMPQEEKPTMTMKLQCVSLHSEILHSWVLLVLVDLLFFQMTGLFTLALKQLLKLFFMAELV